MTFRAKNIVVLLLIDEVFDLKKTSFFYIGWLQMIYCDKLKLFTVRVAGLETLTVFLSRTAGPFILSHFRALSVCECCSRCLELALKINTL